MTVPTPEASPQLHRRLGVWGTTLSGVGIILGAGIYVIIGTAAEDAGSAVWVAFAISAVLAGVTGLSYAELASMFPEAGASSVYAREAFGRRVGLLVGVMLLSVAVNGGGAVALGFSGYLEDLVGLGGRPGALLVLAVCAAIVIVGVRETVAVAVAMTLLEVGGLVFVVVAGAPDLGQRSLLDAPEGALGVMAGATLVFFAFQGFEEIATLSEETREPERTIPRAIVFAVAIATALYMAVAVVAVSAIDWRVLAESDAPLSAVAEAATGERAADALSTVALFATFNTVLMLLATAARLMYGMSGRGLLPAILGRVGTRRTPWVATLVATVLAGLLALGGDIRFVAQATNFSIFVAFVLVHAALIRLRQARPEARRPFRVPWSLRGVPLSAALGIAGLAALALSTDPEAALLVVALGALTLLLSPLALRREVEG